MNHNHLTFRELSEVFDELHNDAFSSDNTNISQCPICRKNLACIKKTVFIIKKLSNYEIKSDKFNSNILAMCRKESSYNRLKMGFIPAAAVLIISVSFFVSNNHHLPEKNIAATKKTNTTITASANYSTGELKKLFRMNGVKIIDSNTKQILIKTTVTNYHKIRSTIEEKNENSYFQAGGVSLIGSADTYSTRNDSEIEILVKTSDHK